MPILYQLELSTLPFVLHNQCIPFRFVLISDLLDVNGHNGFQTMFHGNAREKEKNVSTSISFVIKLVVLFVVGLPENIQCGLRGPKRA